jgi:hypothetical protein
MTDFPVGSIVAFCGSYRARQDQLTQLGWRLCNGDAVAQSDEASLRPVLQQAYGAGADGTIHLPDLRGLFLRGLDVQGDVDQDVARRVAPRPDLPYSGSSGAAVGSFQAWGVGPHSHWYIDTGTYAGGDSGDDHSAMVVTGDEQATNSGNDIGAETRPINTYVYYLIKAQAHAAPAYSAGTVVCSMGAPPSDGSWTTANGLSCPSEGDLADVLDGAYGPGLLPDYRGTFLRGVDYQRGLDPGSTSRTPSVPGANPQEAGSMQTSAVGPHTHSYFHSSTHCRLDEACCGNALIEDCCATCSATKPELDQGGPFAAEARPRNVAVNFQISVYDSNINAPVAIPVGSIIAYAGELHTLPQDTAWQVCDGQDGRPDLRGYFLRGLDDGKGLDPDGPHRVAGDVQEDALVAHAHSLAIWQASPVVYANQPLAEQTFLTAAPTITPTKDNTGAADTRPVNQAVHFLIKQS